MNEISIPLSLLYIAIGCLCGIILKIIVCKIIAFYKECSDGMIVFSVIFAIILALALLGYFGPYLSDQVPSGFEDGDIVLIECDDVGNGADAFNYNGCVGEIQSGKYYQDEVRIWVFYNTIAQKRSSQTLYSVHIKNIRKLTDKETKDISQKMK